MVNDMKVEDRLDSDLNYVRWKLQMKLILKENDLKEFIEKSDQPPKENDELNKGEKDNARAMKLIVDGVKDHLLPIISELDTTNKMLQTLEEMFEINNTTRILNLKDNLSNIKMNKGEIVTSYFMRINELRNQLSKNGHVYDEKELTMIALRGLPPSWKTFHQGLCARSKLPKLGRLKDDCIQEESMLLQDDTSIGSDLHALSTHVDKKKKPNVKRKTRHVDYSKMQCFKCDKYGHSAFKCTDRLKHQATFTKVSYYDIESEKQPF